MSGADGRRAALESDGDGRSNGGPLVIGGTGGSGTRLVMRILRRAGWFMGANLNSSGDALDLARFDWRWGREYLGVRLHGRPLDARRMAAEQREAVERHLRPLGSRQVRWGWKHPHSYLMLPFLRDAHPGLRFVHVVRDGRDMAFSRNQHQSSWYGPAALGAGWRGPRSVRSGAYWAWANSLARRDGERMLGGRYLWVRFEDLCGDRENAVRRLLAFAASQDPDAETVCASAEEIRAPRSAGRWQSADPRLAAAVTEAARPALCVFGYLDTAGGCSDDPGTALQPR